MAQPGINAKLEELQFRLKTDPKSRLFFPLAEELRKFGKLAEAEQVLRTGLQLHATYLSAWVSLGRVLREQGKNAQAVEALNTAMQVDPGNVVAARLLADAYLDLGEKVEAIKKYKLVYALMPSDEELQTRIESLDRELQAPPASIAAELAKPSPAPELHFAAEDSPSPFAQAEPQREVEPDAVAGPAGNEWGSEASFGPAAGADGTLVPHEHSPTPYQHTVETPFDTGDSEPMAAQHAVSPFEDPSGYTSAALEIEQPDGIHIEEPQLAAEAADPWSEEPSDAFASSEPASEVIAPAAPESAPQAETDDVTATTTMADLYVRQGLIGEARTIYEHVLQRHPADSVVRAKLEALRDSSPSVDREEPAGDQALEPMVSPPKIRALQEWLVKVSRREEGRA